MRLPSEYTNVDRITVEHACLIKVLPAFQNEEEVIRTQAITALGLLALLSPQLAQRHIVLFLQVDIRREKGLRLASVLSSLGGSSGRKLRENRRHLRHLRSFSCLWYGSLSW